MDIQTAKTLQYGTILHHVSRKNRDGSALRVKVNGVVKTWKTRPNEVRIPVKHGLYDYGYITENDLEDWTI